MSKKNKFDLTHLVRGGYLSEGETLYFLSDPKFCCTIKKMPNHEYKVEFKEETFTIHAMAEKFLGQEPPGHASRWLRTNSGKTLYEIWQADIGGEQEAA